MVQPFNLAPNEGAMNIVTGPNGAGKTRYLAALADRAVAGVSDGREYRKVVCLSGSVLDKYPKEIYSGSQTAIPCAYLGYRSNHNMFSETNPFRALFRKVVSQQSLNNVSCDLACEALRKLQLEPHILIESEGSSRKQRFSYSVEFKRGRVEPPHEINQPFFKLRFLFTRQGQSIEVRDLSAGERWYLLAILSVCFAVEDKSLLLIDEPENSLHPKRQLEIVSNISEIIRRRDVSVTSVVCTHSPLVIASASNDAFVCDLDRDIGWRSPKLHGQTTDAVLGSQFGVVSARAPEVLEALQDCLSLIAFNRTNTSDFRAAFSRLMEFQLILPPTDPLFLTFQTIKDVALEAAGR